jgi:glucokinase
VRAAIGADLGGTKMAVGVVDEDRKVLHSSTEATLGRDLDELLDVLEAELREALEACPEAEAIGLGIPCTIDHERGFAISAVNLPIENVPLRDIIGDRLGMPTFMDNDANMAALAEHRFGAGRGLRNLVMLTIGTGIGGGLVLEGELYRGSIGAGAELGHIVIDENGPKCQGNCPNHGCVEALASGTALARAGIGRHLGVALASLANVFDPDVITIGGGVSAAGDLLLEPARRELRSRALPPMNETRVVTAELGPAAGMIGSATMAIEESA